MRSGGRGTCIVRTRDARLLDDSARHCMISTASCPRCKNEIADALVLLANSLMTFLLHGFDVWLQQRRLIVATDYF